MIQSFSDETTADLFRERNTRAARRIPRELWRVVQRKLKLLDRAARLDDLAIPAGNRLERLKGQRAERHSIRVHDQYRVMFRWESGHAYEVSVEDDHSGARLARAGDSARRNPTGGVLKPLGLGQVQAADRLGISLNRLNEIVLGKRGITADTALRLSRLLKTSPQLWMRLQADWDLHQALQRERRKAS